ARPELPSLILPIHRYLDTAVDPRHARSGYTTLISGTTGADDFPPPIPQRRHIRLEARDVLRTQFTLPRRFVVDTLESVLGRGDEGRTRILRMTRALGRSAARGRDSLRTHRPTGRFCSEMSDRSAPESNRRRTGSHPTDRHAQSAHCEASLLRS